MKLETISNKIKFVRESKGKYILPLDNFLEKINSAGALVDFVEGQKSAKKEVKYDARKYFVVASVSAMETYFKRTAHVFIDSEWAQDSLLDMLRHDKVSLADLMEIKKREISLGEIISVTYSFQDLESINRFYSKMFAVANFIKEFESLKVRTEGGKTFTLNSDYPHFRERITDMVRLRHFIVHHEGFKGILGLSNLFDMGLNLVGFILAADNYILAKIPED